MRATKPDKAAHIMRLMKIKAGFGKYGKELSHKYIDMCYDSRDGDVWMISMRGGFSPDITFSSNHFGTHYDSVGQGIPKWWSEFEDIADWAEAYLQGRWSPNKAFFKHLNNHNLKAEKAQQDATEYAEEFFKVKDEIINDERKYMPVTDARIAIRAGIRKFKSLMNL